MPGGIPEAEGTMTLVPALTCISCITSLVVRAAHAVSRNAPAASIAIAFSIEECFPSMAGCSTPRKNRHLMRSFPLEAFGAELVLHCSMLIEDNLDHGSL